MTKLKTVLTFIILTFTLCTANATQGVYEVKAVSDDGAWGITTYTNPDDEGTAKQSARALCEENTDEACVVVYIIWKLEG